jgi:hypothetical protein
MAERRQMLQHPYVLDHANRQPLFGLLQPGAVILVQDQAIKNGEHLFAIGVDALQVIPEVRLEIAGAHPLIHHSTGDIDILPQCVHVVSAQKETVKKGGFPLGS